MSSKDALGSIGSAKYLPDEPSFLACLARCSGSEAFVVMMISWKLGACVFGSEPAYPWRGTPKTRMSEISFVTSGFMGVIRMG